jgi:ABC-type cobalamin transport system permease subunit
MMPFRSINGPTSRCSESLWLHAGQQEAWKIRIKSTCGLLMNGFALTIAIALMQLATSNMEQHDPMTHF